MGNLGSSLRSDLRDKSEVQDKLDSLIAQKRNYTDPCQKKQIAFGIALLRYILKLQGDPILVPIPRYGEDELIMRLALEIFPDMQTTNRSRRIEAAKSIIKIINQLKYIYTKEKDIIE